MPGGMALYSRLLFVFAAVMLFARASTITTQEENGVKRPLHNPYRRYSPFTTGLLSTQTERGFKTVSHSDTETNKRHADGEDSSFINHQSNPVQSIKGSFTYNQDSPDDRHVQSQPRIVRVQRGYSKSGVKPANSIYTSYSQQRGQTTERQQATPNYYFTQIQAPSSHNAAPDRFGNIQNGGTFGSSGSLFNRIPPIIQKASPMEDFTAVNPSHRRASLFSDGNPNDAQESYDQGKVPQNDAPMATESRSDRHSRHKTVLQSSDPSSLSGRYWSSSLPSSGMHYGDSSIYRGYKETNELLVPRTWSTSSKLQSGKFPLIKSQTDSYVPSITNTLVSSAKYNLSPEKRTSSITNFSQGPHSESSSEKPTHRKVHSYLFSDPQTSFVRGETADKVTGDGQKTLRGLSTSPVISSQQSLPVSKAYSRHSFSYNQLQLSNEDPSSEVKHPSILSSSRYNVNPLYHNANVAQYGGQTDEMTGTFSKYHPVNYVSPLHTTSHAPFLNPTSEEDKTTESSVPLQFVNSQGSYAPGSEKPIEKSLVTTTHLGGSRSGSKPGRSSKSIYGFRGFKHQPQNGVISSLSSSSSNGRTNSQRYSFDKTMDYRIKRVNTYPSLFPKYAFGQSIVAPTTAPPLPETPKTSTDYSGLNAVGDGGATDTGEPVPTRSAFFHSRGLSREYKPTESTNVFDFPVLPVTSDTSPPPGTLLDDVQSTARAVKLGFKDVQRILTERKTSIGNNPDRRQIRNYKRLYGLKGFNTRPLRIATSEQTEGATTLFTGIDKYDTTQQGPESFKSAVPEQNTTRNSQSTVKGEAGKVNGKDIKTEEMLRSDMMPSILHSSMSLGSETNSDRSSSYHVSFTTENSALGPTSSVTDEDEAISEYNGYIPSTYKMFRSFSLPNELSFSAHSGAEEYDDVQGSKVSSDARLSNVHLGSDQNQTAPTVSLGAVTTMYGTPPQTLNDQSSKDPKPLPKTAGSIESVKYPSYKLDKYKKNRKTYAFLGFQSALNKIGRTQDKTHWNYAEQNPTIASPTPGDSSADPRSAGDLKDHPFPAESTPAPKKRMSSDAKPAPMTASLVQMQSSTRSVVKGKRVKCIKGRNCIKSANSTSLTSGTGNAPVVRLPKQPVKLEAIMYADILGSVSFSGVKSTTQTGNTSADIQSVSNTTAATKQKVGALSNDQSRVWGVDASLVENTPGTSHVYSEDAERSWEKDSRSTEAHAEGEVGDFISVTGKKSGVGLEEVDSGMKKQASVDYMQRQRAVTKSNAFWEEEGSGGLNPSDVSPSMSSDTAEKLGALGEDLLELDYLQTSAGNISFKSVKLPH